MNPTAALALTVLSLTGAAILAVLLHHWWRQR